MKWFGESWGAPICETSEHVDTPTGQFCNGWCDESIEAYDQGVILGGMKTDGGFELVYYHLNCHLRGVFGSVGHQLKRCMCFIGDDDPRAFHDPPGLTPREAADAAVELFERTHRFTIGG